MEKRYEKDPINRRFFEVREKCFTKQEWEEFQKRWEQNPSYEVSIVDRIQLYMFLFILFAFMTDVLGVW